MTAAKSDDKDERSDIERAAWECIEIAAKPVGENHSERVAWNHGAMACHDAIKRLTIVRPECGTSLPRFSIKDNGEPVERKDGEWCDAEDVGQLERELFVSQNDLGRFEESNRQAQEAIIDLREQLAEAERLLTWWINTHGEDEGVSPITQVESATHQFLCGAPVSARPLNNDTDTTGAAK